MTEGVPSMLLRNEGVHGGHVTVGVFIGRNEGSRGKAGTLVVRLDEWTDLVAFGRPAFIEIGHPLNLLDSQGNGGIG